MGPTWNEANDPYDAEGEEEPQNIRFGRRRTEDSKTKRQRQLLKTGTAKPIPPATTETMDTSDDCPGPTAESTVPRQALTTEPETMDTNGDSPSSTIETEQPTETLVAPKPPYWDKMPKAQRKNWRRKAARIKGGVH